MIAPKKLIEVALPLDDINAACVREKSIRHGHPSTLHLWWARRPLAAARAVLFAQLVNDPGGEDGKGFKKSWTRKEITEKREHLFDIIRDLVKWENTTNEVVLERARVEIRKSWSDTLKLNDMPADTPMPPVHDPFAGGGAIPLEAQRLGLKAIASDLNPVAVIINKAMIEIPPKFAGQAPIGPLPEGETVLTTAEWPNASGLAEDVRRYGRWMRDEAYKRIGNYYPEVDLPDSNSGEKATVIAWLWARTVASPDPGLKGKHVPLVSSFWLSKKKGKEVYIEPVILNGDYEFIVRRGLPDESLKYLIDNGTVSRSGAFCLLSKTAMPFKYIRAYGKQEGLGRRLFGVVAEGSRKRLYFSPNKISCDWVSNIPDTWRPEVELPVNPRDFKTPNYGMKSFADLFAPRQLLALNTFSDLVTEARGIAVSDAVSAGLANDNIRLEDGGVGALAYGEAVGVYLSFLVDKISDYSSTICTWHNSGQKLRNTFGRQAIPMTWDYAEVNPFCDSSGGASSMLNWIYKVVRALPISKTFDSEVFQAAAQSSPVKGAVMSTDPPYYDNIGYADLSDYLYVWMRKNLSTTYKELTATLATPKAQELVATPYRHGGPTQALQFFMNGMTEVMTSMSKNASFHAPLAIYYAFKQSVGGWESFLRAILDSNLSITGTWPMRTELSNRMIGSGTNALASSIVIICKPRPKDALIGTRREFLRKLREEMPQALEDMVGGTDTASAIAPVDLAQAAIGPGMAVYSSFAEVREASGEVLPIKKALEYIGEEVDRYFEEGEIGLDPETRFAIKWFESFAFAEESFGSADVLARGMSTSVDRVSESGIATSGRGKVRLLKPDEYPSDWDPRSDTLVPVWEACHQVIRALEQGEQSAGLLLSKMTSLTDQISKLAYRLYTLCERKKWSEQARQYNGLVTSWPQILNYSQEAALASPSQGTLDV